MQARTSQEIHKGAESKFNFEGGLADEETFAKLVAADKRLRRTELAEQIEYLAILEDALVSTRRHCRNRFDGLVVRDAVAVKCLGRATVKQGEHGPARANHFVEAAGDSLQQLGVQIIEDVPRQHGVKFLGRILQRVVHEMRSQFCRR